MLEPGGLLSRHQPGYESRPSQVRMAEAVLEAFSSGGHLMVEAPPGTGKTFAYLAPAIDAGRTVVISTGTRTLQDQLFQRDIPLLAAALDRPVRAALMKGRENYLCLHRLESFGSQAKLSDVEGDRDAALIEQVRRWAGVTESGDRAELQGVPEPWRTWEKIDARSETCLGPKCPAYDPCFLTRMRRKAQEADLIVVNHHLLLSDLVLKASAYGAVIPPYGLLVIDEAHMLEEVATGHLGRGLSSWQVRDLAADAIATAARSGEDPAASIEACSHEMTQAASGFFSWFQALEGRFLLGPVISDGAVLESGGRLRDAFEELTRKLHGLRAPTEETEALARRASSLRDTLEFLVSGGEDAFVTWGERRGRGTFLNASPIDVSAALRELLFDRVESAVLTSATLTVEGSFGFVASRLGLDAEGGAGVLSLPSPFDLGSQSVLYVPRSIPDPGSPAFHGAALGEILSLLEVTRGRAFLLFTSFASLRRTREALEGRVGWPLLSQGEAPRHALLESFRETPNAVLLATSSFWQGVDVPGDALSLVVIEKLPFDVPTDPLVAARCESVRRRGGNPFADYQVPTAVIDLKQGLGRLLRTRTDVGVLAILDGRLRSRGYGKTFLRSLPPYPVVDAIEDVRRFFEGRSSARDDREERRPRERSSAAPPGAAP